MHWKLILAYDGTPYNGWQIQPSHPTVQGTLADAIHRITGQTVLPQGSGRTDTGVHALAQVATFSLTVPIPAANLHRALNRALPASIRVLSLEAVPEDFHARHSALRKTYEYRILPCGRDDSDSARICSPILAPYVWPCRYSLDLAALQRAASHILGTHDFTSFAANDPDQSTRNATRENVESGFISNTPPNRTNVISPEQSLVQDEKKDAVLTPGNTLATASDKSAPLPPLSIATDNIRTIFHSAWNQQDDLLIYRITGNGFLHHMVRNLVGTFVEAAADRISPDEIPNTLAARNRSAAGPTAPASGLFLVEVEY
jgi:tRNA pseudouridine38-40 synthase